MPSLVWFRTDLRARDHTALLAASREGRGVVALFVVSSGEWRAHEWAGVKVRFMLRAARSLARELGARGIPLLVRHAEQARDVPGVVADVARRLRAQSLHFNREHEINEARRDERTAALLREASIPVHAHDDVCLVPPGQLRTGEGRFYTVFTPFKRALLARLLDRGVPEPAGLPLAQPAPTLPDGICPAIPPDSLPGFESSVPDGLWPASERDAADRLGAFVRGAIARYKDDRDAPGEPGTSRLSPYFAAGLLSHRQALAAVLAAAPDALTPRSPAGPATWLSEVLWREFYIHVLAGFPRVCTHRAFQPATERIVWRDDPAGLAAWQQGRTGVPIVDAGMRQLLAEGWMHNRVRMITAMFLSKNLFIDWRLGESWFMRHLVDGFLACNNGGWQWAAGTGTDAAPYFRVFNPASQSRTHDPLGRYIRAFVPELRGVPDESIHEPWTLPPLARTGLDYPDPIVDLSATRAAAIAAFRAIRA